MCRPPFTEKSAPVDIAAARSLALSEVDVTYTGRESHAAVAPHLGINAGDAVTVAQVAIGLLRQQLAPGQMVHGIVTEGGVATNVIPARTRMRYTMRAAESASAASSPSCRSRLPSASKPNPPPAVFRNWRRDGGDASCAVSLE